jgi:predicted adenylyl cyclase CyaB
MAESRRNIELKCRCADLAAVEERARRLGATDAGVLQQHDVFFEAPLGRLKVRDFGDGRAELISYRRPDTPEARGSDVVVCPVADPALLHSTLAYALRTGGTVRKRRHLFLYRHTRIHLDDVEGLGSFVELETVMSGQSEDDAYAELRLVAAALALKADDAVPLPYVELLPRPA